MSEQNGALAQLGEHLLCKQGVIGSIPISSTIFCPHAERPSGWLRTGRPKVAGARSRALGGNRDVSWSKWFEADRLGKADRP